jgi:hypothetical protein
MTNKHRDHDKIENNRHHLMPQSLGGSSFPPNVELWKRTFHDALHRVFENQHTIEKVQTIISLDEAILKDQFKKIIEDIMRMSPQDIYKIEAFENKHKYKRLTTKKHR